MRQSANFVRAFAFSISVIVLSIGLAGAQQQRKAKNFDGALPADVVAAVKAATPVSNMTPVSGTFRVAGQILKADEIIFQSDATIEFTDRSVPWVAIVAKVLKVVDPNSRSVVAVADEGKAERYSIPMAKFEGYSCFKLTVPHGMMYDSNTTGVIDLYRCPTRTLPKPEKATGGNDGATGQNAQVDGFSGFHRFSSHYAIGGFAVHRRNADNGTSGPTLYVIVGALVNQLGKPYPKAASFLLRTIGQDGQDGTHGTNGLPGGPGGDGGPAVIRNNVLCVHDNGIGGDGGEGSRGGVGEDGGRGGNGGDVVIVGPKNSKDEVVDSLSFAAIRNSGGAGGAAGMAGKNGPGGPPGARGEANWPCATHETKCPSSNQFRAGPTRVRTCRPLPGRSPTVAMANGLPGEIGKGGLFYSITYSREQIADLF